MEAFNEETYRQIEDFLTGNLPEPAAAEVRRRLTQDPAFASEVEFMKFLLDGKQVQKEMAVLRNFERYHRRRTLKIRVIRAAVAVAAGLGLFFLADFPVGEPGAKSKFSNPPATIDSGVVQPAQTEFPQDTGSQQTPPPAIDSSSQATVPAKTSHQSIAQNEPPAHDKNTDLAPRTGLTLLGDSEDENLREITALIDAGNGKEALPLLENYLASLPEAADDFEMRIETAKIYLLENDPAKAEFHLQKVSSGNATELLKAEAEFYLALSDRAVGDDANARKRLEELAAHAPEYWKKKAEEVLKTMPK